MEYVLFLLLVNAILVLGILYINCRMALWLKDELSKIKKELDTNRKIMFKTRKK